MQACRTKWQKWRYIFKDIPIVIFKRHGYNTKALNSIAAKTFSNYRVSKYNSNIKKINSTPLWIWINNKEIKISSTEIRNQRKFFRGQN